MLECMKAKDCIPHATLWHYTHPSWFEDLGGFERRENAAYFIEYARVLFLRFRRHVQLRPVLEPAVFALGATHGPAIDTDCRIGHHVAGGTGGTLDDHPE